MYIPVLNYLFTKVKRINSLQVVMICYLEPTNFQLIFKVQDLVMQNVGPTLLLFSESFPTNHYKLGLAESREFNEGFTEWWKGVSRFTPEQEATIRKGAYYTILARPGLRILTYNSQYG